MATDYLSNKAKLIAVTAIGALSTLKMMLVTSAYTPDKDNSFASSATASEASTTGYTGAYGGGGRVALTTITPSQVDASDLGKLTFDPVIWAAIGTGGGYNVRYALLIQETGGSDATSPIIATYDLNAGSDRVLNGGSLTLTPNASGGLTIT